MTTRITVQPHKFLKHLTAPFFGATHDQNGNALPSKRTRSWVFTLGNERKNNHLTFKATRYRGKTINDPVEVSVMDGTNANCDRTNIPLGEVSTTGSFRVFNNYITSCPRAEIGRLTIQWLLKISADQDFVMPDHLEIMTDAR